MHPAAWQSKPCQINRCTLYLRLGGPLQRLEGARGRVVDKALGRLAAVTGARHKVSDVLCDWRAGAPAMGEVDSVDGRPMGAHASAAHVVPL